VTLAIRPLREEDAPAARALLVSSLAGLPYAEAPLAALQLAASGASDEAHGLLAWSGGAPVGVALYGEVAGASGAGKLHVVAVAAEARRRGVATQLCGAATEELRARGARFVLGEIPDDHRVAPARGALVRLGFAEESRVPDFYEDGVALLFLRLDLDRP
jgi:ribosomal protein S18 acetylase RimI-like enzyme